MNIFVTNQDPYFSASALDDKRLAKMALEGFQLLATAMHQLNIDPVYLPQKIDDSGGYNPTHANHPCAIWVRQSKYNALWLCDHIDGLLKEYEKAFGKKSSQWHNLLLCREAVKTFFPDVPMTAFVKAMPDEFRDNASVFDAYKMTLIQKWNKLDIRKPTWKNRSPPDWLTT